MENRPLLSGVAFLVSSALMLTLLASVGRAENQNRPEATVHYVAPGAACGNVNPCYATIQVAVDAAAAGDEVRVAAGTYTEIATRAGMTQSVFLGKPLTVTGGYTHTNWRVPNPVANPTVIDARDLGRGLVISGTRGTTIVQGLRITGGNAGEGYLGGGVYAVSETVVFSNNWVYGNAAGVGGGLYVDDCAGSTLIGNRIFANHAEEEGGGLVLWSSNQVTLHSNQVYSNTSAGSAGGVSVVTSDEVALIKNAVHENQAGGDGGGLAIMGSMSISVTGNLIYANRAEGNGGGGAATAGTFVFSHNEIYDNVAAGLGGGLLLSAAFSAEITDNQVYSNTTDDWGGGLALAANFDPIVSGNRVVNNRAREGGGFCGFANQDPHYTNNEVALNRATENGGGASIADDRPRVERNRVHDNSAAAAGGGLYLSAIWEGGWLAANQIYNNEAQAEGGGIAAVAADALVLAGNKIWNNTAGGQGGGGLYLTNSADGVLINNVVNDNRIAETAAGAGLALDSTPNLRLLHNTISSNRGGAGNALFVTDNQSDNAAVSIGLTNTILVSHTTGIHVSAGRVNVDGVLWYGTTVTVTKSTTATVFVAHQFTDDPAFSPDGYHLTAASAAIDRGIPAGITEDIDGESRPQAAGYDLGADEYSLQLVYLPVIRR